MTSAAIGTTSPKMPSAATFANARSAGSSTAWASSPNSSAPAHGNEHRRPSLRREARPQRVDEDREEPRPAGARTPTAERRAFIGPAPGTGSRASRRARAPRAGGPTRRGRAAAARSRARARAAVWITSPSRTVSNVTPPTESSAISDDARRRPSSERTSTCRGRSSIASRIAWCPPAAASRPLMSTITRSRQPLDLVQDVRADDHGAALARRAAWNSAMRCSRCTGSAPFSGSSSTSTWGSHHERGRDLRALAHALAERRRRGGRRRRASRPTASALVGRAPVGDAVQVGDVAHELAGGEPGRHRFVLRHEREPA